MTDKEQKRIISRNLLRLLDNSHKSQKEAADAIGVSAQTFNTWVKGIAIPRMGKIQKLADYFGVNKTDIIEPFSDPGPAPSEVFFPIDRRLAEIHCQLNDEGIEKLIEYAEFLLSSGKYLKKSYPDKLVEEKA